MEKHQKVLVGLLAVLGLFFFTLIMLILSFIFVLHGDAVEGMVGMFVTYHIHFMVLLGILGAVVGIVSYYGFTIHSQSVKKSHQASKNIIFRVLDPSERIVIDHLIESSQPTTQAQISKLHNMGKVKAHRVVKQLNSKEIIEIREQGKTKVVQLAKDLRGVL